MDSLTYHQPIHTTSAPAGSKRSMAGLSPVSVGHQILRRAARLLAGDALSFPKAVMPGGPTHTISEPKTSPRYTASSPLQPTMKSTTGALPQQ
ncbi:hypothetical protein E2C01_061186 [Portunus trituberculatus]|uniref:Uncharacterized protein n=1 Tax=Portunus trituberculatus TaxID=210409 RepID=A0A5B7HAN3_PORTR|nr:hypothetical protein [Portunus trituberculatus]